MWYLNLYQTYLWKVSVQSVAYVAKASGHEPQNCMLPQVPPPPFEIL